jgi:hypothetical protein
MSPFSKPSKMIEKPSLGELRRAMDAEFKAVMVPVLHANEFKGSLPHYLHSGSASMEAASSSRLRSAGKRDLPGSGTNIFLCQG